MTDARARLLQMCEDAWLASADVAPDDFPEQLRWPLWKLGLALDHLTPGRLMDRLASLVDERGGIPLSQIPQPGRDDDEIALQALDVMSTVLAQQCSDDDLLRDWLTDRAEFVIDALADEGYVVVRRGLVDG